MNDRTQPGKPAMAGQAAEAATAGARSEKQFIDTAGDYQQMETRLPPGVSPNIYAPEVAADVELNKINCNWKTWPHHVLSHVLSYSRLEWAGGWSHTQQKAIVEVLFKMLTDIDGKPDVGIAQLLYASATDYRYARAAEAATSHVVDRSTISLGELSEDQARAILQRPYKPAKAAPAVKPRTDNYVTWNQTVLDRIAAFTSDELTPLRRWYTSENPDAIPDLLKSIYWDIYQDEIQLDATAAITLYKSILDYRRTLNASAAKAAHWIHHRPATETKCEPMNFHRHFNSDLGRRMWNDQLKVQLKLRLQWAIRVATANGTDMNFDPDALVIEFLNAVFGQDERDKLTVPIDIDPSQLTSPFTSDGSPAPEGATHTCQKTHGGKCCKSDYSPYAFEFAPATAARPAPEAPCRIGMQTKAAMSNEAYREHMKHCPLCTAYTNGVALVRSYLKTHEGVEERNIPAGGSFGFSVQQAIKMEPEQEPEAYTPAPEGAMFTNNAKLELLPRISDPKVNAGLRITIEDLGADSPAEDWAFGFYRMLTANDHKHWPIGATLGRWFALAMHYAEDKGYKRGHDDGADDRKKIDEWKDAELQRLNDQLCRSSAEADQLLRENTQLRNNNERLVKDTQRTNDLQTKRIAQLDADIMLWRKSYTELHSAVVNVRKVLIGIDPSK